MIKLAILGYPLGHTLSPALHSCVLEKLHLPTIYRSVEAPPGQLGGILQELVQQGYRGCNVTIPHKQKVMAFLDEIDPSAKRIGAVNTVRIEGRHCTGFNTDGVGFMRALAANDVEVDGVDVVLLGAGGGARSVAFSLAHSGVHRIQIFNRNHGRARLLARAVQSATGFTQIHALEWPPSAAQISGQATIVVNATPVGMTPDGETTALEFEGVDASVCAMDLVYNPLRTRFLESAASAGARTVDGLDMLIFQGLEADRIWLEREVECDRLQLRELLIRELDKHAKT